MKFQPQNTKMDDIPEEPEETHDIAHPSIVPLKEAVENSKKDVSNGKPKFVTVHYSRTASWDQAQVTNVPQDGAKRSKEGLSVVYSELAKQQ
ncbi:uncharacterized protein si:dkey-33i11.1 [Trichomycterus rosablanca]|uniref:uncharacterized protein si:dkey-33i11.1 n=1 Tax=Trichomycterus rosablanca TaxID=2290929 RepID=UPI002F35B113